MIDRAIDKVSLTDRERDILRLLTTGLTDSEIAETLVLTVGTVKWYNRQIYNKLSVRNRTEAITRAQALGLLTDAPAQLAMPYLPLASKHNLPAQISSFIGRSRELAEVRALLLASRLVTLSGPPGTGKTRLALEVAATLLEYYRDGVYFVSLASVQDANLVAYTIAEALDVNETGNGSIFAALKANLHDKRVLLVLDNFEHLLAAASLVSDLLASLPQLTILITSREILRLYGEQDYPVPPLQLPDLKQKGSVETLQSCEAIEMFVQRAHAAQATFALTASTAVAVAMICVHLDGLPLAIELAAARIKFYTPQMLLVLLSNRLEALGEGARDLPARQRTLRATLAWSYDLLTQDEKTLFGRLGIFAGGFSPVDAQAICGDGLDVMAALESLLNKSLLRQVQSAVDESRFMMLETMREYALEKLIEYGERSSIEEQYARYFIGKAAEAARVWSTLYEGKWLDWLEAQHGNVRATLEWSLANDPSGQTSLELIANLARFWELRGYFNEARAWLSKALSLPYSSAHKKAHADTFFGLALLIQRQGDPAAAQQLCREALAIQLELGDKTGAAFTLVRLSEVTSAMGEFEPALELVERANVFAVESGNPRARATALGQLGFAQMRLGKLEEAETALKEAVALHEEGDDRIGAALALSGLGELAVRKGDLETAISSLQQSLHWREKYGELWGIAAVLGTLAWVEILQNNFGRAAEILRESILIRAEIGEHGGIAWCLGKLAKLAYLQKDDAQAALIFGAASAYRASVHSSIDPTDLPEYDETIAQIRARLGDDVYEAVWAEGQAIPLEHLMEYLAQLAPGEP